MDPAHLLRAFVGSCHLLGFDEQAQAALLYLSPDQYRRECLGPRVLDPLSVPGTRALKVIRLRVLLEAAHGSVGAAAWLRDYHPLLDAVPAELANGQDGLMVVLDHLEQQQNRV